MNASLTRQLSVFTACFAFASGVVAQALPKPEAPPPVVAPGPHYLNAQKLYAKGASAALAELELEIQENPRNVNAYVLKARALKGTNQCALALQALDSADRIADQQGQISGSAKLLRAECYYYEREYAAAQFVLDKYVELFPQNAEAKHKYEWLMQEVAAKLDGTSKPVVVPITPSLP
jgi:tetratricopeptide (TPR) repeat protein